MWACVSRACAGWDSSRTKRELWGQTGPQRGSCSNPSPVPPSCAALGKCFTPLCLSFLFCEMGVRVSRISYDAVVLTVVTDGGGTWGAGVSRAQGR